MSIVKVIGFDEGTADSGIFNYSVFGGWDGIQLSTTNPRTGGYCLNVGGGNTVSWRTNFPESYVSGWVYFAFRCSNLPFTGDTGYSFDLMDEGTSHLALRVSAAGRLNLYRGDGTLLASGTSALVSPGKWVQVAWKYTIDNASGLSQVRLDGRTTNDLDYSGDTRNGANAVVNQLQFSEASLGVGALQIDDIVIQTPGGSSPENDWLGDIECRYVFPNSTDASSVGFNPAGTSPAATRHESVDDTPTDEGVTTIESDVVGNQAVFGTAGLPLVSGTIFAVVPSPRALKTAGGYRTIATAIVSGSNVLSGNNIVLTNTYQTHQSGQIFHRYIDGTAWDVIKFNNALFKIVLTG